MWSTSTDGITTGDDVPGVDGSTLGVDGSTLGVEGSTLGVDGSTLGVEGSTLGVEGTTLGVEGSTVDELIGVVLSTGVEDSTTVVEVVGVEGSTVFEGVDGAGVELSLDVIGLLHDANINPERKKQVNNFIVFFFIINCLL